MWLAAAPLASPIDASEYWLVAPPASPPPSKWRQRVPRDFKGNDWGVSWREAKAEAKDAAEAPKTVSKKRVRGA